MKEKISFVIPCYNSTKTIGSVVDEIIEMMESKMSEYDFEIILTNDCSPDGTTYDVIKELARKDSRIKGINLARNFGQPSAVMAGINYAEGDYVVCGDDDGQTPFSEFPKLFEKIVEGYDVVEAKYIQRGNRPLVRRIGTSINECMATWLISKPKDFVMSAYWVVRKFVAEEVAKYDNAYPYIGGLIMRATQNVCNVECTQRERMRGQSGYNFGKMINLWLNGFTSFSIKPLRVTTFVGMVFSAVGLIAAFVTVIRKLINPMIAAGYSSLLAVMLILFGIQFVMIGMLGEYVGRSYMSLNKTPQFVIKETVNIAIEK